MESEETSSQLKAIRREIEIYQTTIHRGINWLPRLRFGYSSYWWREAGLATFYTVSLRRSFLVFPDHQVWLLRDSNYSRHFFTRYLPYQPDQPSRLQPRPTRKLTASYFYCFLSFPSLSLSLSFFGRSFRKSWTRRVPSETKFNEFNCFARTGNWYLFALLFSTDN